MLKIITAGALACVSACSNLPATHPNHAPSRVIVVNDTRLARALNNLGKTTTISDNHAPRVENLRLLRQKIDNNTEHLTLIATLTHADTRTHLHADMPISSQDPVPNALYHALAIQIHALTD